MSLLLRLVIHHGVWNEKDHDVLKNIIVTCKALYHYVIFNKPLVRMLFNRLAEVGNSITGRQYTKINHKFEGYVIEWWCSQKMFSKARYRNNQRQGEYYQWDFDQHIIIKTFYVDNYLHGDYIIWLPTGQLSRKTIFRYGMKHGECTEWHKDGTISSKKFYQNDKLVGYAYWWHFDGSPAGELWTF